MNTLEANLMRSFGEVRKEIDDLRERLNLAEERISVLNSKNQRTGRK